MGGARMVDNFPTFKLGTVYRFARHIIGVFSIRSAETSEFS